MTSSIRRLLPHLFGYFSAIVAGNCSGHGVPIRVEVANSHLEATGGLPLMTGYASVAFDPHEDSFLDTAPGNTLASSLPGFVAAGMNAGEDLALEVISRPDFGASGEPARWLWYWDDSGGGVTVAAGDPELRLISQRLLGSVTIAQHSSPVTATVKLADLEVADIGTHQHFLLYVLDNSPQAPSGVYGFFARLTSSSRGPSAPFLIALNNTDPSNFAEGATMINAAARLPGDFDGNDVVNGADFLLWQETLGSTSELWADGSLNEIVDTADRQLWETNFGRMAPGAYPAATAVPEPAGQRIAFAVLAVGAICSRRCARRHDRRSSSQSTTMTLPRATGR